MCGILACIFHPNVEAYRGKMLNLSRTIRHRGPDWSGVVVSKEEDAAEPGKGSILCHERLAIVGVDSGAQPLVSDDGKIVLAVNGEIYNYRALQKSLKHKNIEFNTHSDCEVIMYLYKEHGSDFVKMLDGMFSFVLLDRSVTPHRVIAARDPIGVTTFYYGRSYEFPGAVYFASELKAIATACERVDYFPPGHFYDSARAQGEELVRYYEPSWWHSEEGGKSPSNPADLPLIRTSLENAVRKRLMSEVPYGVLLSGGLDSSLIASIAARETEKQAKLQAQQMADHEHGRKVRRTNGASDKLAAEDERLIAAWPRLHSFSIGLPGSPDLIAAREAAEFLGTIHHEFTFTVQEGLDALADVVYHLETYDVTTVRASTPMYLLSRKIKATGVKMVLSGEGSDEVFGGYLYFHAAPDKNAFHQECVNRVKNLHTADCLRANKSTMAWGLEARVPFLDKAFLDVCMNIDPADKEFSKGSLQKKDKDDRPLMEKYILRKAFDVHPDDIEAGQKVPDSRPYLPDSILWRQKEQFSDGVGYSWIDGIKEHAEKMVSDEKFNERAVRYPIETPDTKEAYMIRELFESWFPTDAAARTAVRWVPRGDWGCAADPSGRSVAIHDAAYQE
ncbi:asparagine synthase (glutamine-hydrolyzing) [Malassezia vespertilionis]|uniref:asparagine synthase (glutamine-hydrolyzing) n=1 Tax=Malassezia vespertilionis TaxID=2020962 RepID=A0A2N1J7N2_9BASI|nr:asparagine synthase (glutamine-hydrolyzing) [Malassezia vespertilionis]PKI82554.1 Asn1p [Malassezia vespertilionis]WFD08445.1 asparagine synthase (glutamine-hydrolyzing) [Malassezia vespertilionis]